MPNDIMRNAMQALDEEDARAELTPLHRLLLDLAHLASRYEGVEVDEDWVGTIKDAYTECAESIRKVAGEYLAPDGSVLPKPVVLFEVEDGACEIGVYPSDEADVILVDWDNAAEDGEYTDERKTEIRESALPDMVKSTLFERLNSF